MFGVLRNVEGASCGFAFCQVPLCMFSRPLGRREAMSQVMWQKRPKDPLPRQWVQGREARRSRRHGSNLEVLSGTQCGEHISHRQVFVLLRSKAMDVPIGADMFRFSVLGTSWNCHDACCCLGTTELYLLEVGWTRQSKGPSLNCGKVWGLDWNWNCGNYADNGGHVMDV